jgi:hypothetical protein
LICGEETAVTWLSAPRRTSCGFSYVFFIFSKSQRLIQPERQVAGPQPPLDQLYLSIEGEETAVTWLNAPRRTSAGFV